MPEPKWAQSANAATAATGRVAKPRCDKRIHTARRRAASITSGSFRVQGSRHDFHHLTVWVVVLIFRLADAGQHGGFQHLLARFAVFEIDERGADRLSQS